MAGFLRLSHKMANHLVIGYIEIKIDFHPSAMSMRGHGIPHTSFFQFSQSICNWQVSTTLFTSSLLILRAFDVFRVPSSTDSASASVTFFGGYAL